MITKICEYCGEPFESYPSKKARFCSRKCVYKWRSEKWRGDNATNWNGGKIKKTCEYCGELFELYPSNKACFCSRECFGKWQSENLRGENNAHWQGGNIVKICEQCGEEYEIKPNWASTSRFCSLKCMGEWRSKNWRGENSPTWRGGASFEPYCHRFDETFKESIRDKFDRTCFLCPTTEQSQIEEMCSRGKRAFKLAVHHVNYNKDCLCDDSDCEFVPLCIKCHSKTNYNREYWEEIIIHKLAAMQW